MKNVTIDTGYNKIVREYTSLLSPIIGLDNKHIKIQDRSTGVWNNIVFEVSTPHKTYYFKKYRKFSKINNYSPPNIPAKVRAKVSYTVQSIASLSFVDKYQLVPSILTKNNTSFIMDAAPNAKCLLEYLKLGDCPKSVVTILPRALARFHNSTDVDLIDPPSIFSDTKFRDYKLSLQYLNIAKLLEPKANNIIEDFEGSYRKSNLCIVHGDLNSKNILIGANEEVSVIDFEQSHIGTPAYDLAYILSEIYISSVQFHENTDLKNACNHFLHEYLKIINGYDYTSLITEATLHFAIQIIYRFNGPSHLVWTSYVGNVERDKILKFAKSLISQNVIPITSIFR